MIQVYREQFLKVGEVLRRRLVQLLPVKLDPLLSVFHNAVRQRSHVQPDAVLVLYQRHAVHFQFHPRVVLEPLVKVEARRRTLRVPFVDNACL